MPVSSLLFVFLAPPHCSYAIRTRTTLRMLFRSIAIGTDIWQNWHALLRESSSYRKFTPPNQGFVTTEQIVAKHCAQLVGRSCCSQRSARIQRAGYLYISVRACAPTSPRLREPQPVSHNHTLIAEQGGNLVSITRDRLSWPWLLHAFVTYSNQDRWR